MTGKQVNIEGKIFTARSESMNRITFKHKNIRYRTANSRQCNAVSAAGRKTNRYNIYIK
jgi:tartrate dehydratase beta subunit/fumarate hydratase class I family protein